MRTVFFGTAEIACPVLRTLSEMPEVNLLGVVSQPDRPKGRRLVLQPTPIKSLAESLSLPCHQPSNLRRCDATLGWMQALDLDVIVVMAYGQLLASSVLEMPRRGCVNVHTSLLPKYRGAAPIQWAIWNGDAQSGVSLMQMDEGMDTGPIIATQSIPIEATTTAVLLHDQLGELGAQLMRTNLKDFVAGALKPRSQDVAQATHARKITKEDGWIRWVQSAQQIDCQVRALDPWPGCHADWVGPGGHSERFKILQVRVVAEQGGQPGSLLALEAGRLLVACGEGALEIRRLQRLGGRAMEAAAFLAGHPMEPGTTFKAS